MRFIQTVIPFFLFGLCIGQTLEKETCDASRSRVDVGVAGAQALIGGLFEIRNPIFGGYACGQPHDELIQIYEAARWAIDKVNTNNIVPGIKIGMKAYDTCGSQSMTISAAQNFYPQSSTASMACIDTNTLNLGFLGPLSSWTSKPVASLASSLPASVVSPRAASPALSDKSKYPYFLRTAPSLSSQVKAMTAVLDRLNWKRVLVVHTEDDYGMGGFDEFVNQAFTDGICITKSIAIPFSGSVDVIKSRLANLGSYGVKAAVFFGSYVRAKALMTALETLSAGSVQWIFSDLNLMEKYSSLYANGALMVGPKAKTVTEFSSYFAGIDAVNPPNENPWFTDWYMTVNNCKFPGVTYAPYVSYNNFCQTLTTVQRLADFQQLPYVAATVKAVYSYAKALRNAQVSRCGNFATGTCQGLKNITTTDFQRNFLKPVDFVFSASDGIPSLVGSQVAFDENGDFITQDFKVWNYNNRNGPTFEFNEVGSFENNALTLRTNEISMYNNGRQFPLTTLPTSPCPSEGCLYCVIPRDKVDFYYTPGDITIAAVLSARGAGKEPFSCGDYSLDGLIHAAAMQHALNTAKTAMPGILNGVSIGGLFIDICDNAETGQMFLDNVLGERKVVKDKYGQVVNPHSIKAIIESLPLTLTQEFSMGIQAFRLPEVGTLTSSISLMDRKKYPYYSRVVPGSTSQAAAMTQFLTRKGWYYVQVIHSPSFKSDADTLKYISAMGRVCVAASYELGDDGTTAEILEKVHMKSGANVVIVFLEMDDIKSMLQALKAASWQRNFILVGSETWGNSNLALKGYEDVANGVITFQPQLFNIDPFRSWINLQNPRVVMDIPWFRQWYQTAFQCYLDLSWRDKYPRECTTPSPITNAALYEETFGVTYSINAVYAVAKALDMTLKHYCGNGYSGVCVAYRAATDSQMTLLKYIREVSFTAGNTLFEMNNGEGLTGYDVFQYSSRRYDNIGVYNTRSGTLSISNNNVVLPTGYTVSNFTAFCPGNCIECAYLSRSPYMYYDGDMVIAAAFGVHNPNSQIASFCGDIKTENGVQLGLALTYAVHQVNNKNATVSLNGINLGTMLLDHCGIQGRTFELLSYAYSGTDGFFSEADRALFNPSKILAWLTDNTAATYDAMSIVNALNLPLISPLSTSTSLSDRENFPTYFRTLQGDVTLSTAMVKLAQSLGFQYLTVVYSEGIYGKDGLNTFESVAAQEGLCVVQKLMVSKTLDAKQILERIRVSNSRVVILWTNGADTSAIFQNRAALMAADQGYADMVFIAPMPFMSLAQSQGAGAANTFMLNVKSSVLSSYREYVKSLPMEIILSNTFLFEYYMVMFQCDLPGFYFFSKPCIVPYKPVTDSPLFVQDNFVVPTINAVYALVGALDSVLKEVCGQNYDGACSAFFAMDNVNDRIIQKMESISFTDPTGSTFQFIEREGNVGMDLYYFNGSYLQNAGEYAGASLQVTSPSLVAKLSSVKSECPAPCLVCIQKSHDFAYIPGDILLGGIFDVHENSLVPFSCGDLNINSGYQLLEAFNYAIQKVNDKSGQFSNVLKNIKLGGVGLDSCQSSIRTGYLVSDIHNGLLTLTRNSLTVDPDDIAVYIGGYSSDSSLYLARILKTLEIPQISYGSSSDELLDQDRYPYFMRTVPADDKQTLAMISFLAKNDIRYVQVVHSPNNYGTRGAMKFKELSIANKICIAQVIGFPDNFTVTRESADKVVRQLLTKPVANTIVVFADTSYINEMLKAMTRNSGAKVGQFHFIGSESWGNSFDAISGVEYLAEGSVTLKLESTDLRDFDIYIGQKYPGNYPENPWFPEFYEEMANCYLTVPNGKHNKQCLSQTKDITGEQDYIQDTGILHVINAVYAAAYGLDASLKSVCGENYTTVCEQFKNDDNRDSLLMRNILKSRFVDASGETFEFRQDRRDGNKGYVLYDIQEKLTMNEKGYSYENIGDFSSSDVLTLQPSYTPGWDGSCDRAGSCSECPTVRNLLQRYMLQPATSPNSVTLLAAYGVHNQGSDAYRCGSLNMKEFYKTLAFFFTLDKFFSTSTYDLRGMVLDTCSNPLRIDQDVYSLMASGKLCNTEFTFSDVNNNTIAGFLTSTSANVVAANRVLSSFGIPIISSSATSTLLSDKVEYPYFARTVPPDDYQMAAIAEILKANGWKSASVIYSGETYGISGLEELTGITSDKSTCVGYSAMVPYPGTLDDAKAAVQQVLDNRVSNVIVLVSSNPRLVLDAAKALGVLGDFIWIGTETWGNSNSVLAGYEDDMLGAITIELRSALVKQFAEYVAELSYSNNRKNIPNDWFEEFYQTYFKCNLPNAKVNFPSYPTCALDRDILAEDIVEQPYVLNTIAATYAYVQAIEAVATGTCRDQTFQACFSNQNNWNEVFSKILATKWQMAQSLTLSGDSNMFEVKFNSDRFWDIGYVVNYFTKEGNDYVYKPVGSLVGSTFTFDKSYNPYRLVGWTACQADRSCDCASESVVERFVSNETLRTNPPEPRNYYFYNTHNETINGRLVTVYDQTYTWPIWAIATAVPTCVGLFITIFLFLYLLIFYPVRGGTTILGFMMMFGVMGVYAINFAFFLPASEATCGAREFLMGVMYAIVFAPLLVKAVDNWRFSEDEYSVRKYKGITNACTLFLIALGVVCLQLIIPIEWLILENPSASIMDNATNLHDWMWCDPHDMYDKALVMSMIFVLFLVLLTAIFAAMAWDSDSNYYESRWILVSCVCTAGCMMVWMIVSTNAGPPYRDASVALGNFVNATAILIFMTIRKVGLMIYLQNVENSEEKEPEHDDRGHDLYSTVYSNQGFDDDAVFQPASTKLTESENGDVGF